jgi:carbonic anhydrase
MKNDFCKQVFDGNKSWVQEKIEQDANFFNRLKDQQNPQLLWIGCSDSRVPANQVIGVDPGEVFVHRNISNVVVHTDMNLLSVLEYSVQVLKVKHIAVVGHYGCGGVKAAMQHNHVGIIDGWLRHIRDVYRTNNKELNSIGDEIMRHDRFVELNVQQQVRNLAETTIVQQAWATGQDLEIHGWVYGIKDGILKDLGLTISNNTEIDEVFRLDF